VQTVDTAILESIERIAAAQVVMAVAISLIALIVIGASLVMLLQLRAAHRMVRELGSGLERMQPQLGPMMERAREATHDIAGMTGDVRRRMDDMLHTVEDLHRAVKRGGAAAEERIRRFDAVLDVVQTEAEELLLDAAATAHGLQQTARALREPSARGAAGDDLGAEELPAHEKEER
jgi:uncharacterized protein YoxC